jgi:antitoxin component YwqK of YwqJK toxin-antitoxin module
MTSTRYLYLALIGIVITLSGCSTTQIPTEIKSQMTTAEPVIGYFKRTPTSQGCGCGASGIDPHYSPTPVEDGYYRLLLGRNAEGLFLIQDFYQKNKQPQTSPLWVKDPMHVYSFDSEVVIGSGMLYYPDGKVVEKFHNINSYTRQGESFYPSGERAITYTQDHEGSMSEYWYKSGKPAAKYVLSLKRGSEETKAWDENGNRSEDSNEIIDRILAEMEPGLTN